MINPVSFSAGRMMSPEVIKEREASGMKSSTPAKRGAIKGALIGGGIGATVSGVGTAVAIVKQNYIGRIIDSSMRADGSKGKAVALATLTGAILLSGMMSLSGIGGAAVGAGVGATVGKIKDKLTLKKAQQTENVPQKEVAVKPEPQTQKLDVKA